MIVSALSYAIASYFLTEFENSEIVNGMLRKFKIISEICAVNELIIEKGLNSNFTDFENSLQYFSALKSDCIILITRNDDLRATVNKVKLLGKSCKV